MNSNLDFDQRSNLLRIDKSGRHLLSLINDILDLSKIDAGKVEIEHIPFEIAPIVQDVRDLFEYKAINHSVTLYMRVPNNLPTVVGDPLRIKQVLLNFTSNAIKFTEKQGEVSLEVKVLKQETQRLSLYFSVRDSGIGLTSEQQQRIFDSFQQADSSTTRKYGGTGLGLTISKHIVDLMGGKIGVESELQHGSTFWFSITLPIDTTAVATMRANQDELWPTAQPLQPQQADSCTDQDLQLIDEKLQQLATLLQDYDLAAEHYCSFNKPCFDLVDIQRSRLLTARVASYEFDSALIIVSEMRAVIAQRLANASTTLD